MLCHEKRDFQLQMWHGGSERGADCAVLKIPKIYCTVCTQFRVTSRAAWLPVILQQTECF